MEKIDLVHLRQWFRRDSRSNEDNDTFIAIARESSPVKKVLEKTEKRVNALQTELNGLYKSRNRLFKTRPIEWTEAKLEDAKTLLQRDFAHSGETQRQYLGLVTHSRSLS